MLVVPVIEDDVMLGILEVFSSQPGAFSTEDQDLLENFANDCVRLNRTMNEARLHPPTGIQPLPLVAPAEESDATILETLSPREYPPQPEAPFRLYEGWTLALGAIVILAAAALSFMIGSRVGWIRSALSPPPLPAAKVGASAPAPGNGGSPAAARASVRKDAGRTESAPKSGELVVYDHGKIVFRMKPASKSSEPVVAAAENKHLNSAGVWLAPEQAERRLRNRVEPTYPAAALAAHSSGEVVVEVLVGEDGTVVNARGVSGDPVLTSAALDAVRHWQYEPYRRDQRTTQFQTDVKLRFSLPD
jgi:TonB family protein